jgi:glycerophosphoryl diester phosphodiesterase
MTKRKRLLIILVTLLSIYAILALFPRSANIANNPLVIEPGSRPVLIAHGGGNKEFPDNTLEAFYHAYSIDSRVMMETDVSITKDGVVILSHDTTLDRKTTLQNAPIADINYADLLADEVDFSYHNVVVPNSNGFNVSGELHPYRNYLGEAVTPLDVEYPEGVTARHESKFLVTTLEQLITAFPDNYINVEIKQSGEIGLRALAAVIDLMIQLDDDYQTFSRIVLASFHKDIYQEMIRIHKDDVPALLYSPESTGVAKAFILSTLGLDLFYRDTVAVLQLPTSQYGLNLSTKAFVKQLHRHNIAVHYWTIDDPDEMRRLIEIGADGIMTNLPSLLKSVYDEYSYPIE